MAGKEKDVRRVWIVRILAIVLLMGMGSFFSNQRLKTEQAEQFYHNFVGFSPLETLDYNLMMADYAEIPIDLHEERNDVSGQITLHFTLHTGSEVYLSAAADSARTVLVRPLVVTREDGTSLLLPVIQSATEGRSIWSDIRLGYFTAGSYTVTVTQNKAVIQPLPASLRFRASRPSYNSPLSTFIDHYPVVEVKNQNNVLDDIPLLAFSVIYRRDADFMVASYLIFSSENGGRLPPALMKSFQRTVDVEWVMKQVFTGDDGQLTATAWQFQGKDHEPKQFHEGRFLGQSPMLNIGTPNNTFSDEPDLRQRLRELRPSTRKTKPLIYAPKPIFVTAGQGSRYLIDRAPEMQEWSLYEIALENCVDFQNDTSPAALQFQEDLQWVQKQINVSFPDRGCRDTLLQLPWDRLSQISNQRLG